MTATALLLTVGFIAVFGALIGSFLNVVVYRVPAGRSVVTPPSACGNCGSAIRPYDNIPVISWVALGGHCRDCRSAISVRYPLVEAATAVAFAFVAWWFWAGPEGIAAQSGTAQGLTAPALAADVLEVVAYLYLAAISIALALIDLDSQRLPNTIVLPGYIVGAALLGMSAVLTGNLSALVTAAVGAAAMFGLYLLLALASPGGMGYGDVKLAGVLGIFLGYLGWSSLIVGAFAAFLLGGVYALGLLATRRAKRGSGIPFGPWMLAGAWLGIVAGPAIGAAYLALLGVVP